MTPMCVAYGSGLLCLADLKVAVMLAAKSKAKSEQVFISMYISIHDVVMMAG